MPWRARTYTIGVRQHDHHIRNGERRRRGRAGYVRHDRLSRGELHAESDGAGRSDRLWRYTREPHDGTIVVGTPSTIPPIAGSPAPIVDAGPDRNVDNGATVTLAASASESAGATLTFAWNQIGGPPVVLSDATAATAHFTAPPA